MLGFAASHLSGDMRQNHTRDQTAKVQYVSFQWKAVQRSIVQFEWTLQHVHHLSAAVQTRFFWVRLQNLVPSWLPVVTLLAENTFAMSGPGNVQT